MLYHVLNIRQRESCVAFSDNAHCCQKSKNERRKKSLMYCQYIITSWRWKYLAVRNMESPKKPCDHLKANVHRWQLGGRKKSARIWIDSYWNTHLNWLPEEHVPDARITGNCLSTPRDPCRRWTREKTTQEAWRVLRNFDNKQNSQAISQFSQVIRFDKDHLRNDKKQNGSNGDEKLGQVHLPGLRRLRLGQIGKGRTRGGPQKFEDHQCFSISSIVSLTGSGDSFVSDGVCKQYTHFARFHSQCFSRVAHGSST